MTRAGKMGVVALVAGLVLPAAVLASGTMQKAPGGAMQKAPTTQQKATSGAAPAIKVEAQSLTVTPSAPQAGQQVTVKFVFKNTGTGTVAKVPWSIHLYTGNQTLKADTKTSLEPGTTYEASATWTPGSAGTYKVQGYIDPTGKELKNTAPVSAQIKELDVTVAAAPAATLVTQILDYQKAKAAGAQFANSPEGGTEQCGVAQSPLSGASVQFTADCRASAVGIRATPEAFMNFQLKNGWKVKSIDTFEIEPLKKDHGDWQWRQRPSVGADAPGMKMHIWAEGPRPPLGYAGWVYVGVRITIEGPQNTNPYD